MGSFSSPIPLNQSSWISSAAISFPQLLLPRDHGTRSCCAQSALQMPRQVLSAAGHATILLLRRPRSAGQQTLQPGSMVLWHCGTDLASIYHFAGSKKVHVIIISHSLSAPLSLLLGKAFSSASFPCSVCFPYLFIYLFLPEFCHCWKWSWPVILQHSWLSPLYLSQKMV